MRRAHAALLLLLAVGAPGCRPDPAPPPSPAPPLTGTTTAAPRARTVLVVVPAGTERPAAEGPVAFAEVVATRAARERGLGGRERLRPDHGMLFVYRHAEVKSFWMKDCLIGLDIAFLADDGTIARLVTLDSDPGVPDDRLPRASSLRPVRYVLEMEAGWFAAHGIREGDRVDVTRATSGVDPE